MDVIRRAGQRTVPLAFFAFVCRQRFWEEKAVNAKSRSIDALQYPVFPSRRARLGAGGGAPRRCVSPGRPRIPQHLVRPKALSTAALCHLSPNSGRQPGGLQTRNPAPPLFRLRRAGHFVVPPACGIQDEPAKSRHGFLLFPFVADQCHDSFRLHQITISKVAGLFRRQILGRRCDIGRESHRHFSIR